MCFWNNAKKTELKNIYRFEYIDKNHTSFDQDLLKHNAYVRILFQVAANAKADYVILFAIFCIAAKAR